MSGTDTGQVCCDSTRQAGDSFLPPLGSPPRIVPSVVVAPPMVAVLLLVSSAQSLAPSHTVSATAAGAALCCDSLAKSGGCTPIDAALRLGQALVE